MPQSKKEGVPPPSKTEEKLISCKHFILSTEASCKANTYNQWAKPMVGSSPSSHVLLLEVLSPRSLTLFWFVLCLIIWMLKTLVTSLDRDVTSAGKERAPGTCLQNRLGCSMCVHARRFHCSGLAGSCHKQQLPYSMTATGVDLPLSTSQSFILARMERMWAAP